jgi:large subunit ribosomal protein L20
MVHGLKINGVDINRKVLADIAISDPQGFADLAELSKKSV